MPQLYDLPPAPDSQAWPVPTACGALGVAWIWHLPRPKYAGKAARDATRRQLTIAQVT